MLSEPSNQIDVVCLLVVLVARSGIREADRQGGYAWGLVVVIVTSLGLNVTQKGVCIVTNSMMSSHGNWVC